MLHLLAIVPVLTLSAQPSPNVGLWGEVVPTRVSLGDVIFMEVSAHNQGESAVEIPATCLLETGTLSVEIADREESTTFRFLPDGCPMGGDVSEISLEPGQKHVLGLFMLRLPRLDWTEWRFWDPQKWRSAGFYLDLRCGELRGRSERIFVERRPDKEMRALLELYGNGFRAPIPPGWDIDRPTLGSFGLLSFPTVCSLPENLEALEETLSPGSLRDCARVTRLTARVFDAPDLATKRAHMSDLLAWNDTLPELQRAYFCIQLAKWLQSCKALGAFRSEFRSRVIDRVPEQYVGNEYLRNYRKETERRP